MDYVWSTLTGQKVAKNGSGGVLEDSELAFAEKTEIWVVVSVSVGGMKSASVFCIKKKVCVFV